MKKTLMSLAVVSALMSGAAMAAPGDVDAGQVGDNSASQAELHFTGKVTSSMCQVSTSDTKKEILLGELSKAALLADGRGPSKSFQVSLVNCDPTVDKITYTLQDKQGSEPGFLVNSSDSTSAKNVGVYIEDNLNFPLEIGTTSYDVDVQTNDAGALPDQVIPLTAYIGQAVDGSMTPDETLAAGVTAGLVDATAVITIRATAPVNPGP